MIVKSIKLVKIFIVMGADISRLRDDNSRWIFDRIIRFLKPFSAASRDYLFLNIQEVYNYIIKMALITGPSAAGIFPGEGSGLRSQKNGTEKRGFQGGLYPLPKEELSEISFIKMRK